MEVTTEQEYAYILFAPKYGKSFIRYPLQIGPTVIGSSLLYDIRINRKNETEVPLCCVVEDNGLALLINKGHGPVVYNGTTKINHMVISKNGDKFPVGGIEFVYSTLKTVTGARHSLIARRGKSVMPNIKPSHIPSSFLSQQGLKRRRPTI